MALLYSISDLLLSYKWRCAPPSADVLGEVADSQAPHPSSVLALRSCDQPHLLEPFWDVDCLCRASLRRQRYRVTDYHAAALFSMESLIPRLQFYRFPRTYPLRLPWFV